MGCSWVVFSVGLGWENVHLVVGGIILRGEGGLPTFHMGNYFLLKGYLLFLFLDLNLSFKKGRYTVYDPALCLGDLRSNFLLYNF